MGDNAIIKEIRLELLGLLRDEPREPVVRRVGAVLELLEKMDSPSVSSPQSAAPTDMPRHRKTKPLRYSIAHRGGDQFLEEKQPHRDQPFRVSRRDYDAVTAVFSTAPEGKWMSFADILRMMEQKTAEIRPEYLSRTVVRWWLSLPSPLVKRAAAKYMRAMPAEVFGKLARRGWDQLAASPSRRTSRRILPPASASVVSGDRKGK